METWEPTKPAVRAAGGVVVSQHGAASRAGARVLEAGGNAVDAAVVTALVGGVLEPWLSGLGGGGFLVTFDPSDGTSHALDFGMVASRHLDPADYPLADTHTSAAGLFAWPAVQDDRNLRGPHAIGVPGSVAGFAAALERLGTLAWSDALEPAAAAAEAGLTVDAYTTLSVATAAEAIAQDPVSRANWLPGGQPPVPPIAGSPRVLRNEPLARTFRRLQAHGADDFYRGGLARDLVHDLQAAGSRIAYDDFAQYTATWTSPSTARFGNADVYVMPGLSGGPTLLRALELFDEARRKGVDPYLGTVDAIRSAYAERLATMGAGAPAESSTAHVSVVDGTGRVASLTSTLLARFGAKITLPTTGIMMNNMMMWFDPRPAHPNAIRPGARPLANMCPTIAVCDDGRHYALGAAGGRRIVPAVQQLLRYLIVEGNDLATAGRKPRLDASGGTVDLDPRLPNAVRERISAHTEVRVVADEIYPSPYAVASLAGWEPPANEALQSTPTTTGEGACVGVAHAGTPWPAAVGAAAFPGDAAIARRTQ